MNKVLPFLLPQFQRLAQVSYSSGCTFFALLCIMLLFVGHGMHVWRVPYLERVDAWIYDARLLAQAQPTPHPDIVIVDVDEKSLSAFGRWPWTRGILVGLVDRLTQEQQVAAVGFDMVFAEPESPGADAAFAHALMAQPVVLGYYFTSDRGGHASGSLPQPVFATLAQDAQDFQIHNWTGYGGNLSTLIDAAPQAGFFNAISDPDGLIRSAPLMTEYQGQYYESLALGLYRRYLAQKHRDTALSSTRPTALPNITPRLPDAHGNHTNYRHISHLDITGADWTQTVPVDESVAMLVPYRGRGGVGGGSFRYISAADVLQNKLPALSLKNKVVLIGSSAPALEDLRATPFGGAYPGVEVQANLIAGLIDGNSANKPDFAMGFDLFQLLTLGLLLLVVLPRLSATWAMLTTLAILAGLWFFHRWAHYELGWVLPLASSLGFVFCAYLAHSSLGFWVEGQRRRHLTQLFGSYVSPHWVSQMVHSRNRYSMQASHQVLTVMFCDMRGFTKLAGGMAPLALQALLNDIFSRLSEVIQAHGGTIDKYMGDCVMAFWGAPEVQSDHAARAVRCAIDLQAAMRDYNQRRPNLVPIQMGIGINTGMMCVGDMGSKVRRSYTVIGDAVNLASRLEGLCKTHNAALIVSAATKAAAATFWQNARDDGGWDWIDLGSATIDGGTTSIHIFTLSFPTFTASAHHEI
jgi:adenylate cyclase